MALSNAERQRKYREKQKEKNADAYLAKERERKKKSYVPSKELTTSERKTRNSKKKISNQRHRAKKSALKKQESVLKVKFPAKASGSRTRIMNRLDKNRDTIRKLEEENAKLGKKYSSLLRKWQRKNKTFSNSPMSRAQRDINQMKTNKRKSDKVRRKLAFHYVLTDEIKEGSLKHKFKSKQKSSIYGVVGGKILQKYRMISYAAKETGLDRNYLSKLTNKVIKENKRMRMSKEAGRYKEKIQEFYERSDNSTTLPNKKDVKTKGNTEVFKKILNDYIDNLFEKFLLENPSIKVSRATFFRCRPEHVLPVAFTTKRSCLCIKHQNVALMTNKGLGQNLGKSDGALDKFYDDHTNEELISIIERNEALVVTYSQWKRVDVGNGKKKVNLINVEMSKEELKGEVIKQANMFREHVQLVRNQYTEIRRLKENLPDGHVVLQVDFSENYTCTSYEEVQSAFWNKSMVTIHPMVAYYRNTANQLLHKSFAIISDELSHNASAVLAFIQHIIPILKELIPDMIFIHYISDSPTSQYRNKYMFNVIADHQSRFQIGASWQYFEAGHGKGPCDGVGAVAKRMADNAVKREKHVIQDAKGFFQWASTSTSSIQYEWVGREKIAQSDNEIKQMNLQPIKGTMGLHAIFALSDSLVATRKGSCFCQQCFVDGKFVVESACDGWEKHTIKQGLSTNEGHNAPDDNQSPELMEVDEEYNTDDWVAALYQGTWYVGKIVEVDADEGDFNINFLTKTKLRGSYTFKYPAKPDLIWVYKEHILCKITEPAASGKSGRSYILPTHVLEKIEKSI